jgi:glycosyltransferase involved in cell wall biosynthesis
MKYSEPLVSVVMAVHNEELYLKQCLDSIIAQTYQNWELIAVNDQSTDRSVQILQDYADKDPRILVFHSKRHKLIPALKEGYNHCQGILINRMDADDQMPDYKLQVLVEEWQKYGKGTIIAGGTSHFVEEGEVGEGFQRYDRWLNDVAKRGAHYEEIYQECVIPSHCWIIHKDDFDRVGAFEPEVYPEDYDLCFRFYKHGLNVIGMDRVLHYWRDHDVRISRTWDCYQDNRYFDLKLKYFYEIDRDRNRPLVVWGAGRNGKDLARLILSRSDSFRWVCDNVRKIGKEIYSIRMEHFNVVPDSPSPQILIVVNSPEERIQIRKQLKEWNKKPVEDFWFFT